MSGSTQLAAVLLQSGSGIIPRGTRVEVFQQIYTVFLLLGTLVGIVVISYMLYNAYKYRDGSEHAGKDDDNRPQLGELPRGSGGGRKLFVSFALSAIVVISLVAWTYGVLLFVEEGVAQEAPGIEADQDPLVIDVTGYQFGWRFEYPNGHVVDSAAGQAFRVPADRVVVLNVTSSDVFHNFGIPDLRVKSDAIPGQYTDQWFIADTPGETYTARCYELCGSGHSFMVAEVQVMSQSDYQQWYQGTSNGTNASASA